MATLPVKSKYEIINDISKYIESRKSNADIYPGRVLRDILIEAPMEFFYSNYALIELCATLLSFEEFDTLLRDNVQQSTVSDSLQVSRDQLQTFLSSYLDGLASNYSITRKQAVASVGRGVFYTYDASILPVDIPANIVVQTNTTPQINFSTTDAATLAADINANFNSETGAYEVPVDIVCATPGTTGNVGINSIQTVKLGQATDQYSLSFRNTISCVGGIDTETDTALLGRIKLALSGNFQGTSSSIIARLSAFDFVRDVLVVTGTRDTLHMGTNLSDITAWVSAPGSSSVSDSVIFNSNPYVFSNQPVQSINSFKLVDLNMTIPSIFYTLSKDTTSARRYSANAYDSINFLEVDHILEIDSTIPAHPYVRFKVGTGQYLHFPNAIPGMTLDLAVMSTDGGNVCMEVTGVAPVTLDMFKFPIGAPAYASNDYTLEFTNSTSLLAEPFKVRMFPITGQRIQTSYNYNANIARLNEYINGDSVKFVGQDITIYEGTETPVYIAMTVQITTMSAANQVTSDIQAALTNYFSSYAFGTEINSTDILTIAKTVRNVIDVKLPLDTLSVTSTGSSDLVAGTNEYFKLFSVSITPTTTRILN